MSGRRHATDLAFEQARNLDYLRLLRVKLTTPIEYGLSRSQEWLKGHPHLGRDFGLLHPLVGRVGLSESGDLLPDNFYIGPRYIEKDGITAYSWAAPVARLFFQPDTREDPAPPVVVRRTLTTRLDEVVGLRDEWVDDPSVYSPFAAPDLTIPAAPGGRPRRRPGPGTSAESRDVNLTTRPSAPQPARTAATPAAASANCPEKSASARGMRAYEAVMERLLSPRSERLNSVLATLQPDQYDLAARPADEPLVIQGHPGTGKTVVAAYRAAALTDPERGSSRVKKLLVVGPTEGYVRHVTGLIAPLADPTHVTVTFSESLLSDVTGVKPSLGGTIDGQHDDVDALARGLTDAAVRMIQAGPGLKTGRSARAVNLKTVYELVRANGTATQPLSRNREQIAWMKRLPSYESAIRTRRYLPLMAQCALSIQPVPATDRYDHIIVDEAQDVSPIEWNILDQYNRTGGWTLIGDMNQRRSDTSYSSWSNIIEHLAIGSDLSPVAPIVIRRGYRSTTPILRFADKLLPKSERGNETLQAEGPKVDVRRVAKRDTEALADAALTCAEELASAHGQGTTAIITVDPALIVQALHRRGWRRKEGDSLWAREEGRLFLHVPETARGLEFDAVVVVEPGAFPKNLGRAGQLYTSLTRANRQLAVVYQSSLPDELRSVGR